MILFVWMIWQFLATCYTAPFPSALFGLMYLFSVLSLSLSIVLALLAIARLLLGVPVAGKVKKAPLLDFIGLSLPPSIQLAIDSKLGYSIAHAVSIVPTRRGRGRVHVAPVFGNENKGVMSSSRRLEVGTLGDLNVITVTVNIGSRKIIIKTMEDWTVRDVFAEAGLKSLVDKDIIYASHGSRVIPIDTLTATLSPNASVVANIRVLGGAGNDANSSGSGPTPTGPSKSVKSKGKVKAINVDSETENESAAPTKKGKAPGIHSTTRKVLLSVEKGGSGDECKFFNPAKWPAPAVKALSPLVNYTGDWDEDFARRCIGDMHQAWIQYQTPGYRSDLDKVNKYTRSSLNWNRPMTALEPLVGYAGPAGTGPKELQRPISFVGVVRWIERVYNESRSNGTPWIQAKYLGQFDLKQATLPVVGRTAEDNDASTSSSELPEPKYSQLASLTEDDTNMMDMEDLPKAVIHDVDSTTASEDPEITLDRLQVLLWKEAKAKAMAEGKAAQMPDTPRGNAASWKPRMFRSEDISDRASIIKLLRARLLKTAWNDQQSFSSDKASIESLLDDFVERILVPKTDAQLYLIQLLPDLMITPNLLHLCGLTIGAATDESSAIYIKMVSGGNEILEALKSSPRQTSKHFGQRLERFLQCPLPSHMSTLSPGIATPDRNRLYYSHVGRFISGAANRSWWEHQDIERYDKKKGGRVWLECMVASGVVGKKMEYLVLADHSMRVGGDWCKKMAGDELFFSTLLLNPFLTNVGWPGTGLPDPPAFVGERISSLCTTESWLGKATLSRAAQKFRCKLDPVTLVCLQWLGWKGLQHPNDWLDSNRETVERSPGRRNRWFRLISNVGDFIPVPWTRTPMGKTGQMHEVEFRLFISTPLAERSALVLRPAGVDLMTTTDDIGPEQRAISLSVDPGSTSQRSVLYDKSIRKGTLELALLLHPSYRFPDSTTSYTFIDRHGYTLRNGTSSNFAAGCSVTVRLSEEGSRLLNGVSIPYQDCTDLAIWPDVVRRRLAQTGYSKSIATDSSVAGPSTVVKPPIPDQITDEWIKLMSEIGINSILLRNSIIVSENEVVNSSTQNPADRGYTALLDTRRTILQNIRSFILTNEALYDISSLPNLDNYRRSN